MDKATWCWAATGAVILLTVGSACAALAKPNAKATEMALAREYLFAACVSAQYQGKEVGNEAGVWAGGIIENGNQEAAVYGELADLARTLTPQPEATQSGTPLRLQSCLRLYNSAEAAKKLKRIIR